MNDVEKIGIAIARELGITCQLMTKNIGGQWFAFQNPGRHSMSVSILDDSIEIFCEGESLFKDSLTNPDLMDRLKNWWEDFSSKF